MICYTVNYNIVFFHVRKAALLPTCSINRKWLVSAGAAVLTGSSERHELVAKRQLEKAELATIGMHQARNISFR